MSKEISKKKREIVFKKYNGRCAYCGRKLSYAKFHVDHISPRMRHLPPSMRGSNDISNLNPSCPPCNISKSTFSIEKWKSELLCKYDRMLRDSSNFRLLDSLNLISRKKSIVFYFEKINQHTNHGRK